MNIPFSPPYIDQDVIDEVVNVLGLPEQGSVSNVGKATQLLSVVPQFDRIQK